MRPNGFDVDDSSGLIHATSDLVGRFTKRMEPIRIARTARAPLTVW